MSLDTSKHEAHGVVHGRNGIFLSSLGALSILAVTSHHHAHRSHATLIVHQSRPAARLVPAPTHHQLLNREHGTRVTVQDLFGKMPVRVKQRGILFGTGGEDGKQMEILQKHIVGLLLAWDVPVMLTLWSTGSTKKLIIRGKGSSSRLTGGNSSSGSYDLSLTRSILSQATYINPSDWENWVKISAQTPFISIQGAISLQPAPSKRVQFIALGVQYLNSDLGGHVLYDEVNRLFGSSSFGKQEDIPDGEGLEHRSKDRRFKQDGYTNKQLKGGGRGVDRWPKFSLRIDLRDDGSFHPGDPCTALERESTLSNLLNVLRALIDGFLNDHHFRPRATRTRKCYQLPSDPSISESSHSLKSSLQTFPSVKNLVHPVNQSLEIMRPLPSVPKGPADQSSVGKVQKEKRRRQISSTHVGDNFGDRVKLPSFSRIRELHHGQRFSAWSRIKSGKPESMYDELLFGSKPAMQARRQTPRRSPDHADVLVKDIDRECRNGNTESTKESQAAGDCSSDVPMSRLEVPTGDPFVEDNSHEGNIVMTEMKACETTPKADQILTWINPISKATVLVNARSGLVVTQQSKSHSSASTNACSQSPAAQCFKPVTMFGSQKRLARSTSAPFSTPKTGSWVGGFLKNWDNPVFRPTEESIQQISFEGPTVQDSDILHGRHRQCSHAEIQKAFAEASSSFATRLSKENLTTATAIAQVDKKFILVRMDASSVTKDFEHSKSSPKQLLVLIDQHAADERIRVEELLVDLCEAPTPGTRKTSSSLNQTSAVKTTLLQKSITFQIQAQEHRLFTTYCSHFAYWGILFDLSAPVQGPTAVKSPACKLTVRTLPAAIAERCRIDPKMLIELLRGEVWKREELGLGTKEPISSTSPRPSSAKPTWLSRISSCPMPILEMLYSRSCRSAIMFNDVLTIDECSTLIASLAKCVFPFQCAHGRPSMVPLVELGIGEGLGVREGRQGKEDMGRSFGKEWRRWRGIAEENEG